MQDNNFNSSSNFQIPEEKPSFLITLCIITFVVSGFMLLSNIYGMITFNAEIQQGQMEEAIVTMSEALSQQDNPFGASFLDAYKLFLSESIENYSTVNLIALLSANSS